MGARHVEDLVAYQWAHELKVDRRHFTRADIGQALSFGVRCTDVTRALHASQVRFIEGDPRGATGRRRPRL